MTQTPPWGSPDSPGPASRAGRPRWTEHATAGPPPPQTVGGFFLVVEQLAEHDQWRVEPPPIWAGADRDVAREAALELARSYRPDHPETPHGRLVLRSDPDNLIVLVQGTSKPFHFRVTVVERVF